ncbi:MAG: 50S ribosomal protein L6 [Candidatus Helarchaeota archaeon]
MTEIYNKKVAIPKEVKVKIQDRLVEIKGSNATLVRDFNHARQIIIKKDNNSIVIQAQTNRKKAKALVGTISSHINNMIKGSIADFKVIMKIVYAHFPVSVRIEDSTVYIDNFLGERAARKAKIMGNNTKIKIDDDDIIISGPNIEYVTQTAANIRLSTKIKNKDPRIFQDGIYKYKKLYNEMIIWELKI